MHFSARKRMSDKMIKTENLIFEYTKRDEEGNVIGAHRAIDDLDLKIEAGQFIAILGHNGSGKSTLAKHMNAILTPTAGSIWVDGKDTKKEEYVWDVRQSAGMVFQNPDNQIIGTVVEEDVGFGPENLGVPTEEIWERGAEPESSGDDRISSSFPEQIVGRTETTGCHRRCSGYASKVYCT